MPDFPRGNRPDTTDPYSNPVLGALRGRLLEDSGGDRWDIQGWSPRNWMPKGAEVGSPEAFAAIMEEANRKRKTKNIWIGEGTVQYKGDWLSLGFKEEGPQRLLDAVVACFTHEGLTPQDTYIVPSEETAAAKAILAEINPDPHKDKAPEPPEFEMGIRFTHVAKSERDKIDAVVRKISAASRKIQEKQSGKGIN